MTPKKLTGCLKKKVGANNRTLWRITKKSSKFWGIFIIQTSRELQNAFKKYFIKVE
jgi:hypothetical protein